MCVHVHVQHAHFVLNPDHIEVSNMAASVDSTNHLVSKHLKSTHNCAPCGVCVCVCVSTTETWSKLIGIPSRCPGKACATPSVGPGAEPTCYEQTKNSDIERDKLCVSTRYLFPILEAWLGVRELSGKPHICTRLIDKGLGCGKLPTTSDHMQIICGLN